MADVPKPKAQHKVKKGETFDKIAKKYGFANPDDIWKYPKNAALVKERKQPENVQVDDVVVIPAFNDEERKEIQERQRKLNYAANMEKLAAAQFAEQAKAYRETADVITALMREHAAACPAYIKEYEASVKTAENWSFGVDVAALVIGILRGLDKIATKCYEEADKVVMVHWRVLDACHKQFVKESDVFLATSGVSELTKQTGKKLAEMGAVQRDSIKLVGALLLESYGKMTSPSFYGQTYVMLKEGKGWSEAASYDLKRDAKSVVEKMKAEQAAVQKAAVQRIAEARKLADEADKAAKSALKKQKEFAEEARRW